MKLYLIAIILIVILVSLSYAFYSLTQDTIIVNVIKAERITTGTGIYTSHKYMVYTKEETFQNTDILWAGKFNSSDMHGVLSTPGVYELRVFGWRVPFLSMHRNIIKVISYRGEGTKQG